MFVLASFAGCFGGDDKDDDGDDNGNGNDTPPTNGGNNTTNPPPGNNTPPPRTLVAPIPAYALQMSLVVDGEEVDNQTGPAFVATPGQQAIFRFDGSTSTDPDGTVEAGSWIINGPGGEFKAADFKIRFNISSLKATDFGVYEATLKVLDNDNVLNSTTFYFALNYANVFEQPGMNGPGQATCDGTEDQAGTPVGAGGVTVTPGTFKIHSLTIGDNATVVNLTLTFVTTAPSQQLVMRLLPPGYTETSCAGELGNSGAGASPRTLTVTEGIGEAGSYGVRVDLVGADVDSYAINVEVNYAIPTGAAEPDEEGDPEA